ncbi:ribose 5-phosphate isomerase B [Candidatus Woesearchaeota archaeon]|nr:ribose 5-phosphate isomerase B [Candidatus Woesearchaeota archaeon]
MAKVIIGSDHAGFRRKEEIKKFLERKGIPVEDLGTHSSEPVDYPEFAGKVAKRVVQGKNLKGILVCGSGTGMAISANKIKGIRAVAAYDTYSAKMSRSDNDTNVLGLRGRQFPLDTTKRIVSTWLSTPFSKKARHKRRIGMISHMERTQKR